MHFEKVLVTGGSGLLGRFVVDELVEHADVGVLDIKPPAQNVPYLNSDILDSKALGNAVTGQDAIIHLAGIDDGNDFPDEDYFRTNVQGTWNLLHAAEAAGVRKIVVASSTAVYGVGRDRMPDYLPMDEEHLQRPTATYSLTKQIIEVQCRSFVERGSLSIVCLRPTLIVRPEREAAILAQLNLDDPHSDAPRDLLSADGESPYGALSVLRSYVRSADAARCFRLALGYDANRFDVFNVGAVDGIGHEETIPRLERVYGRLPEIRRSEHFQSDACASVLDSSRARDRLGWEPHGDWDSIVNKHRSSN
ncbi:MAG: NAD-dependent epimerase/dehydratase family protein [Gammaproteobacteria bacterium]|nr:NAD-dependent epimerase/dehydratase family protein [Gammaproteobacteria bacterium]